MLKIMMSFFNTVKQITNQDLAIDFDLIKQVFTIEKKDLKNLDRNQAATATLDFRIEPFNNADQLVTIVNDHYFELLTSLAKLLTSQWDRSDLNGLIVMMKNDILKDLTNDASLWKQPHRFYEQIYQPVFLRFYEQLVKDIVIKDLVVHYQWPNHHYDNFVNFYDHYLKVIKTLQLDQVQFLKSFDPEIYYQVLNDHFAINYDGDYEQTINQNRFWSFYQKLSDLKPPALKKKQQMKFG